ncbi:MAG: peptide-methionine (S)-S-oxide reductase MsrA [Aureliella sp.]
MGDQSWKRFVAYAWMVGALLGCNVQAQDSGKSGDVKEKKQAEVEKDMEESKSELAVATFAGGCFWCTEAVFEQMEGVEDVVSGYIGGRIKDPSYEAVCTGRTGHAEACEIKYDPEKVSFIELMKVFFKTHDPTTLNRQGADVGTQYRSAIFFHDDEQKKLAEEVIQKLDESGAYRGKIVTEVTKASEFYIAEDKHQDFYARNPNYGYCAAVVRPKVEKFKSAFPDKVVKP